MIVDLFAGPGGFSEGLKALGLAEVGIEWDDAACATARAAGHERIQADVASAVAEYGGLSLEDHRSCRYHHWVSGMVDGLIASPPCQAFSMAGKGEGRKALPALAAAIGAMGRGEPVDSEALDAACGDERAHLVLEPLRWVLALRPTWIALEQVPPVLPLWKLIADLLRAKGYWVWCGVLSAEMYGVPQTRKRAILMAHRERPAQPPTPTHQRYVPGEPQRLEHTLDGEILPWVSMAEALGWDGGDVEWHHPRGPGMAERHGERRNVPDEPAPTMRFGERMNACDWVSERPAPTVVGTRRSKDGMLIGRQLPEGEGENVGGWGYERPSTNVNGDPRISSPGRHDPEESGSQQKNAVRVSVQEAAVLQSFRPDYPWQGSRTAQFRQVGDAVPPRLAQAILFMLV